MLQENQMFGDFENPTKFSDLSSSAPDIVSDPAPSQVAIDDEDLQDEEVSGGVEQGEP